MYKSKSRQSFLDVVPAVIPSEVWDDDAVGERDRLQLSPSTKTRNSARPPGCRVCFLAQKYGLTPREVTLIALICSGKSGRVISQILGIGMPTIRQHCGRIHGKIGTHSRLAIGLWAIRNGMVETAVQPKSDFPCTGSLRGVSRHEIQPAPEESHSLDQSGGAARRKTPKTRPSP
jgi:DNA-binding CsgD family transcriptional regulator